MGDRWQFWIDRGGTFTDVVARTPDGDIVTAKLLSEDPIRREDAAAAAIRTLSGCGDGPLPEAEVRIGTTIATNALLERRGESVLLAITRGFGDALAIGTQERPDIFARAIVRPPPVQTETLEIDERVTADGTVLTPLDEAAARAGMRAARARGIAAIAIVLMHGHRYPAHEARLAEIAAEIGFAQISVSHRVGPLIKLIGRGDTTVVDAYLSPPLRRYVDALSSALGGTPLFMQSSGGLADGRAFRGKDAILSGPAGGIVGMARTAEAAGFGHVIGFDMGGTSTDVSLYAGRYERAEETVVAGARIRAPMMRIHTVAAGGGSICRFDGGRLVVGPASAGAVPGPACYGRGGPLTVTDCNLLLGKLRADRFPRLFGASGDAPLDVAAAAARMEEVRGALKDAGRAMTAEAIAEGFVAIAVANMANAIKAVSVARGEEPAGFALACFGGAGGQHACLVADALGMETVLVHPLAGVLSAYGIGLADLRATRERTVSLPIGEERAIAQAADELGRDAAAALAAQGVDRAALRVEVEAHLRLAGTDATIPVPLGPQAAMREAFAAAHRARFGFDGGDALVVEMLRAEAILPSAVPSLPPPATADRQATPIPSAAAWLDGRRHDLPVHDRAAIAARQEIAGPALIVDPVSTTVVEPGWRARADDDGMLVLSRIAPRAEPRSGADADPVRLEIFSGLFMGLAEEMGAALRHSAISVNIRERLDFSCALFDAEGNLIANAPHIPVHLGSMGETIRALLRRRTADGRGIREGDVYVSNAPFDGGTHLPDITVSMPVFADGRLAFFAAARGHHADVGGISPGSMPAASRTIEEEGVVIEDRLLVDGGRFDETGIRAVLGGGRWPSRAIDQNVADLKAQVAACARGRDGLAALCARHGTGTVVAYMAHLRAHSAAAVRTMLHTLGDGEAVCALDDGAEVRVAVRIDREAGGAIVDFTGTSSQQPTNFNAPRAVVRAATLYVLRLMIDEPVPMNDGCLEAVEIRVPEGSMLDPRYPAAVVAGNVEVSQVVTDALLAAFGAMAGSQGTMNNLTFGDDRRQYYETIAGGAGAGPGHAGASVVQTHMTNSRLTDPEILETRMPVLVEAFAVRPGSGGGGRHAGGDGAVRRLRFLEPQRAAILSNRRRVPPRGLAGGGDGQVGANRIERADGAIETLGATASVEMGAGDVLVIETPGGGGWGD